MESMKGMDLINFIIDNHLEDTPVFEDGKFIGFMTDFEAAEKFDVGTATIRVWINEGLLDAVRIGETIYIPQTAKNPKERIKNEKITTDVSRMFPNFADVLKCATESRRRVGSASLF